MLRSKLGLLALCAMVFGVMGLSASAAQASLFEWLILNSTGTTSTELKALLVGEKDSADITLLAKELGIKFAITCTNFELIGVNLEKEGTLTTGGKVKFTGCEAYGKGTLEEPLGCHLHSAGALKESKEIESNKVKGALLLHEIKPGETELVTKIEPEVAEGALASFLTEKCSLPEVNPIKGKFFFKDCELMAELHLVKHLLAVGPLTSLFVGSDNAEHLETGVDGSIWVKLGGEHTGLAWGGKHNLP